MNNSSLSATNRTFSDFIRRFKEAIFAVVLFVIFALLIYFTKDIQLLVINTTVDARFWPKVCGIGGCILSVILFVQSVASGIALKKQEEAGEAEIPKKTGRFFEGDNARTLVTYALTLLYVGVLNTIGFLAATIIYLFALFMLLSEKEGRKVWKLILVDVLFTVIVFFVFRYAFQMLLPTGTIW